MNSPGPPGVSRAHGSRFYCASTIGHDGLTPLFAQRPLIKTVEWNMLDKRKFYPMSMMSSFTIRCFLYPLTLVRTRLQVQQHNAHYTGTLDAFRKIIRAEGVRGLYKGFFVSVFQVVSGMFYVSTYEGVRHILDSYNITRNDKIRAFVGGGCASIVGQTIIVPFDVISQHVMLLGGHSTSQPGRPNPAGNFYNPLEIVVENRSRVSIVADITKTIYFKDGLRGFYRGYLASLCTYVPNSASWWTFYHFFQDSLWLILPENNSNVSNTAVKCVAAVSSGCASSLLTNPLDLIRTRVQVNRRPIPEVTRQLWRQEGCNIFTKGLTARMSSSVLYSLAIIFGYETVKRWSVHTEYKNQVLW